MTIFFVLLALIFLLIIFLVVRKVRDENAFQNLPPGPWGLPLLGHLVSLGLNPHLTMIKWKKKYGPIIRCRFGSFPTVLLCDSKLIKEAFSLPQFSGRPEIQVYVENNSTRGIALSEGRYNAELRQFTIKKLKEFGVGRKSLEDKIQQGVKELMDFVQEREGLPVKSTDIPCGHILKTLWSIMMTDELNPEEAENMKRVFLRIVRLGSIFSELASFMPWMENITKMISFGHFSLLSARGNELQEYYSFLEKLLQTKKLKAEAKGHESTSTPSDIMDIYMKKTEETKDKSSPFHASHDSAIYFLGDIFGAGVHTTFTVLLWMLNYMAKHPEVQQNQMPYTDSVISEVLRLGSVIPLGLPHKTTADVCFHGYTIKKDTMIFANTYGVHHNKEIFGDPESFRPDRWRGEQGKKLKSEHLLPFLTGKRNCAGEMFGHQQLFLYITTLFQQYTVEFDLGRVPQVKGVFGIFLEPTPFTVVFRRRKL